MLGQFGQPFQLAISVMIFMLVQGYMGFVVGRVLLFFLREMDEFMGNGCISFNVEYFDGMQCFLTLTRLSINEK